MDLQWWITVIGVPVCGATWAFIWHGRSETEKLRKELSDYKLLVATSFSSLAHMRDVETRIMTRLEKMDEKLDRMAQR